MDGRQQVTLFLNESTLVDDGFIKRSYQVLNKYMRALNLWRKGEVMRSVRR